MSEPVGVGRPIILRAAVLEGARSGKRTHITLPAWFVPGRRLAVGQEAREQMEKLAPAAMRLPTPWTKLRPGDVLWVKEETAYCEDTRDPLATNWFFKADLKGGHIPVPGGAKGSRYVTGSVDASKMARDASRYTLAVEAVRLFRAQEITWDEVRAEGAFNPHQTVGAWWQFRHAYALGDWDSNPEVCGLTFRFVNGNIDTGERWNPPAPPDRSGTMAVIEAYGRKP